MNIVSRPCHGPSDHRKDLISVLGNGLTGQAPAFSVFLAAAVAEIAQSID
jgi:hypothetical protein